MEIIDVSAEEMEIIDLVVEGWKSLFNWGFVLLIAIAMAICLARPALLSVPFNVFFLTFQRVLNRNRKTKLGRFIIATTRFFRDPY